MIVCPKCNSPLKENNGILKCISCGIDFPSRNNILNFLTTQIANNDTYDEQGLDILYKLEDNHFWFIERKRVIIDTVLKYIDKKSYILDAGAGTGNIAQQLFLHGYENVAAGELFTKGLLYAEEYGIKELYQFDILNPPFRNHFDAILFKRNNYFIHIN